MKARIKSNGKIVEVISRFMPRKRNAASRDWVCNLSDGTCIDESQLEYIEESIDGLDEAAEEYAYNNWEDNDYHTGASEGLPFDAIGHTEKCFKAGAEWMIGIFMAILKEYREKGIRCMLQSEEHNEPDYQKFWDGFQNCAQNIKRELEVEHESD